MTDVLTAGIVVAHCRGCRLSSLDVRGALAGGSSNQLGARFVAFGKLFAVVWLMARDSPTPFPPGQDGAARKPPKTQERDLNAYSEDEGGGTPLWVDTALNCSDQSQKSSYRSRLTSPLSPAVAVSLPCGQSERGNSLATSSRFGANRSYPVMA